MVPPKIIIKEYELISVGKISPRGGRQYYIIKFLFLSLISISPAIDFF